jgi:ribonuclease HII
MPVKSASTNAAVTENNAESKPPKTTKTPKPVKTGEVLHELLAFDRLMFETTKSRKPLEVLVGTDEVGRGCLAGPVVAAAVILPPIAPSSELAKELALLNDSKAIPPDVRDHLSSVLKRVCRYEIAEATVEEIDEINILQATLLAMRRAVNRLKVKAPAVLLVDGNKSIPSLRIKQLTVTAGDSKSASIAAASVLAKVHRDRLMCTLGEAHPEYMWHSNKGYGSRDHRLALDKLGMTPWHRRTFSYTSIEETNED